MDVDTKAAPFRLMNCPTASRTDARLPSVSHWILPNMRPTTRREMSIARIPGTAPLDQTCSRDRGEARKQLNTTVYWTADTGDTSSRPAEAQALEAHSWRSKRPPPRLRAVHFDQCARICTRRALRSACIDIGFFYLTGHGFTPNELNAVLTQGRSFFGLPVAEKMKVLSHNVDMPGFVRTGALATLPTALTRPQFIWNCSIDPHEFFAFPIGNDCFQNGKSCAAREVSRA
jgi:hypothetical protein